MVREITTQRKTCLVGSDKIVTCVSRFLPKYVESLKIGLRRVAACCVRECFLRSCAVRSSREEDVNQISPGERSIGDKTIDTYRIWPVRSSSFLPSVVLLCEVFVVTSSGKLGRESLEVKNPCC